MELSGGQYPNRICEGCFETVLNAADIFLMAWETNKRIDDQKNEVSLEATQIFQQLSDSSSDENPEIEVAENSGQKCKKTVTFGDAFFIDDLPDK